MNDKISNDCKESFYKLDKKKISLNVSDQFVY